MATSNISIQLVNNAEPLLAYAKVPLTLYNKSHVIVELKVLGGERGPWVALPQRKEGDGWVPIIQIPEDIWEKVKYAVLLAYNTQRHLQPSSKQTAERTSFGVQGAKPLLSEIAVESSAASNTPLEVSQSITTVTSVSNPQVNAEKQKQLLIEQLPVSELIKLQPRRRIPLPDRQERISFLEQKYGKTYRGKPIKYMTNRQLYAISQKCGYR
jgi:DNA-binding cell septation regulator SpoVG